MYFFYQLSSVAQNKAIMDYLNAWNETHPHNPLNETQIYNFLTGSRSEDLYDENGELLADEELVTIHDFPYIVEA